MTDKMIERFKLIAEDIEQEKRANEPKYYVVYNTCYGGFSISKEALDLMCEYGHPMAIEINNRYSEYKDDWMRDSIHFDQDEIPRHDPILVRVVRELGKAASGASADLDIQKIYTPMYKIHEYDGMEWVETPESIEWIIIK